MDKHDGGTFGFLIHELSLRTKPTTAVCRPTDRESEGDRIPRLPETENGWHSAVGLPHPLSFGRECLRSLETFLLISGDCILFRAMNHCTILSLFNTSVPFYTKSVQNTREKEPLYAYLSLLSKYFVQFGLRDFCFLSLAVCVPSPWSKFSRSAAFLRHAYSALYSFTLGSPPLGHPRGKSKGEKR